MEYSNEILIIAGAAIVGVILLVIVSILEERDRKYATENTHYRLAYSKDRQAHLVQILVYSNSDGAYWLDMLTTLSDNRKIPEAMLQGFLSKPNSVRDDDVTL